MDTTNKKETLGIIGGLGPLATACFMEKIISMTAAKRDQDHIRMLIYNWPDIPDRTGHILNPDEPDPLPAMRELAIKLQESGVKAIAIPCVTAQFYHERLQEGLSVHVMNGVRETAQYLSETGCKKAGILATNGTVRSNLFGDVFKEYGIDYCYPSPENQEKVMSIIYDQVKAGNEPDSKGLTIIAKTLLELGAERVILGCTELSVIKNRVSFPPYFLDVLDVMARHCVKKFSVLRSEYERL